jgi:hypothetical protein
MMFGITMTFIAIIKICPDISGRWIVYMENPKAWMSLQEKYRWSIMRVIVPYLKPGTVRCGTEPVAFCYG